MNEVASQVADGWEDALKGDGGGGQKDFLFLGCFLFLPPRRESASWSLECVFLSSGRGSRTTVVSFDQNTGVGFQNETAARRGIATPYSGRRPFFLAPGLGTADQLFLEATESEQIMGKEWWIDDICWRYMHNVSGV